MDNIIMTAVGIIGGVLPIVSVLIKLNTTIVQLDATIKNLSSQMNESKNDRKSIHEQLNNHETRLSVLENIIETE